MILTLAMQVFTTPIVAAKDTKKPLNIVIMVSDDQRWDQLGVVQAEQGQNARWPFIETPRLDALAAQGVRFRNAFVTTSLCSPSRSAILTGQYNHTNGIIDNFTPFTPRPSWATALQAAGYTTAIIGKWHHGEQRERPGFDYAASFLGQGNYHDTGFYINGRFNKTRGYIDERTVDFAIDFLEDRGDEPFAMLVGFKAVHQPFIPMAEHAGRYTSDVILEPWNWYMEPPWGNLRQPTLRNHHEILPYWSNILRTNDGLDKNVGRILDAVDRLGLADHTLVIYTSDNGTYLGEHHLGDKRSAYEESMRVPLLVRLPGVIAPGSISDAMVLNIDLAPTILDLAIREIPPAMQGLSLRPLFSDTTAQWREAFIYEYWQENEFWIDPWLPRTPTILAVRTPRYKLVTYPDFGKWTELFDLQTDPYETRNLFGYRNARGLQTQMCALLQQLRVETDYNPRPSMNKWLIGLTDSYITYQLHASTPAADHRPPLMHPAC
jgi:arylsulfatase A-like enzyme